MEKCASSDITLNAFGEVTAQVSTEREQWWQAPRPPQLSHALVCCSQQPLWSSERDHSQLLVCATFRIGWNFSGSSKNTWCGLDHVLVWFSFVHLFYLK